MDHVSDLPETFVPWGRLGRVGWRIAPNGCHIWTGKRDRDGYGRANIVIGGKALTRYVQRIRYEREIGPIPLGLVLDHYVCSNGRGGCVNPHHCRPVTDRENILRGDNWASKGAARTHCRLGHPLSGDNLEKWALRRGKRVCRMCRSIRNADRPSRARIRNEDQSNG